jgi:hypothetical protein
MLTVEQAEQIAQRVWRNASRLPDRADRVEAVKRAASLVELARARLNASHLAERERDDAAST